MKKKVLKRVCSTAMGALMFICLPITSFAARTIDVSLASTNQSIDLSQETEDIVLTGTMNSGIVVRIKAADNTDRIVILQDLDLASESQGSSTLMIWGTGKAIIELDGTNKLKSKNDAALGLTENVELTIKDDNGTPGSLEAIGGMMCPGIGSSWGESKCDITIDGGTITATGGEGGAGIGGSLGSSSAKVTINDGTVTAIGGFFAAGIGASTKNGNQSPVSGDVTINGGTVIAIGGDGGAGIGGGFLSSGSSITVGKDAKVYAVGGSDCTQSGKGVAIGEGGTRNSDGADVTPDISGLYKTGSITTFAAGTTLEQIKNNEVTGTTVYGTLADPNAPAESTETTLTTTDPVDPADSAPAKPAKPGPSNKPESPKMPEYTERSYIADVNVAAYVAAALKTNASEVTIDFGDNICLTPDIMKDLFTDNRVAKNCMFSHKGKRFVLRINAVDANSKAYADAFEALKKEPDGLAGFLRMAEIFKALGVTVKELAQ